MKYHRSIVKHDPKAGSYGDCFRACVASVFNYRQITDVPHFLEKGPGSNWGEYHRWLARTHDAYSMSVPLNVETLEDVFTFTRMSFSFNFPYILTGTSIAGVNHCVVANWFGIIHDPSAEPDQQHTIIGPTDDGLFWIECFVLNTQKEIH